jgi:hypothetical protein
VISLIDLTVQQQTRRGTRSTKPSRQRTAVIKVSAASPILAARLLLGYGRYWKGAQGVIFVYNVSNKRTFEGIEKWMEALPDRTPKPQALPMLQAAGQAF